LTRERIEQKANLLLAEHLLRFPKTQIPPVPIDEIVEHTLKFHIEFDDLIQKHGAGTLGAVYMDRRTIAIDESLDPEAYPGKEGRCRYTIAHEVAHVWLHKGAECVDLERYTDDPSKAGSVRELEWQADVFAAALLMPGQAVRRVWKEQHPEPLVITEEILRVARDNGLSREEYLNGVAEEMAALFKVSTQAMRIRLGELGLLPTA
jgi:Zn-dependent peptidase ImmA (M78 family)